MLTSGFTKSIALQSTPDEHNKFSGRPANKSQAPFLKKVKKFLSR